MAEIITQRMSVIRIDAASFTNVFLIRGDGGCVLVDAGYPNCADRVLEAIARQGVAPGDIRLILITHGHTDHFGSAAALRERTGAPVAVHARDAEALRRGINHPGTLAPTGWQMALLMRMPLLRNFLVPDHAPAFEPDVLFEIVAGEACRLDEYGVAGQVIPTPGHTPGAISVLLDGGEVCVGDLVMGDLVHLRPQRPGPPIVAWNLEQNYTSLRRLLARSPRMLYVGHGGPFEPQHLTGLLADGQSSHDRTSDADEHGFLFILSAKISVYLRPIKT